MAKQHTGFPGIGGNMQQLMRQAQKTQQNVAQAQEEIGEKIFEVSVGGGAVKLVLNGKKEFQSVTISPECIDPEDPETLQDLILAAVNEAVKTTDDAMTEALNKATGGLDLGMLGL